MNIPKETYLWIDNAQAGPFDLGELKSMCFLNEIVAETFYWTQGMEEWKQLGTFVEERMGCPVPGMKPLSELNEDDLIMHYGANLGDIGRLDSQMQREFERWKIGQSPAILEAFPASELYRQIEEDDGIDWQKRWMDKGGKFYNGRMIAVKNTPIWKAISDYGAPYPPFSYNSSMGMKDVRRRDAVSLGVIQSHEMPCDLKGKPLKIPRFKWKKGVTAEMKKALLENLTASYQIRNSSSF